MKLLTKLFFCTFIFIFSACEPEELSDQPEINRDEVNPVEVFGDTGGNEADVIDDKKED